VPGRGWTESTPRPGLSAPDLAAIERVEAARADGMRIRYDLKARLDHANDRSDRSSLSATPAY
jgi:hypothetical protein